MKTAFLVSIFNIFSIVFLTAASLETLNHVNQKDPIQFLHFITDQVLTELKQYRDLSGNHVDEVVNHLILPNVDFDEMSQWIAGRSIWSKAATTDRDAFIKELKRLLVKTYASTLSSYNNEKIEFQTYKGDQQAKRVQIKSTVIRPEKDNLAVDYRLIAVNDSWKVYDVIIEGVSILQGFRTQFSDDIKMHGLKAVTVKIKNHNENINKVVK